MTKHEVSMHELEIDIEFYRDDIEAGEKLIALAISWGIPAMTVHLTSVQEKLKTHLATLELARNQGMRCQWCGDVKPLTGYGDHRYCGACSDELLND